MSLAGLSAFAASGGDWVIYGLLLCSAAALAAIVERAVVLLREERELEELRAAVLPRLNDGLAAVEKAAEGVPGSAARILRAGLAQAEHGPAGVEDCLVAAGLIERAALEKRLLLLGTLGNNAPFVGLFGTVLGVIKAFHDLSQSSAGPEVVMRGLSEALVATAVGLFVAIPCVVGYNHFQKKVKDILTATEAMGRLVLAQVRAGKRARA
ncbi:MAG TPA: MotA/TolQ/ExbB proton channel family protein [Elusimicrobiota bacterium]|nr:MotA/TolQ/ExbB proton channel family protein [Elusimicrobiota bacterium]